MKLLELSERHKEQYNPFVAAQESGSFLQSWEWGEWQARLGRAVYRYQMLDNSGAVAASVQLIKMPLPFGQFYLYAPYGPVADGNLEFSISNFQIIINEVKSKFPNAVFIRIEPKCAITNLQSAIKTVNIQPGKTLIINLTKPEDQLLAEMHPKTRYNIKLAQKHGVEIQNEFGLTAGNGLFAKEAVELIAQTAERQKYTVQGGAYFEKLVNFFVHINISNNRGQSAIALAKADSLPNNNSIKVRIYKAIYQKRLLASAIMVDFGKTRTYLFGGSSDLHREVMAPHLLHWTAMTDAKKESLASYDFWGVETASGQTPGFVRFKMGFGGEAKEYPGAYDVPNNKFWYYGYNFLRTVNRWARR